MSDAINLDRQADDAATFRGKVDEAGKLRMEEPGRWLAWLAGRKGKLLDVTVTRRRERRSNAANRYWRGVVVPLVADLLSREAGLDPPLSEDAVHYRLVESFGAWVETPLGRIPVRSSKMDSAQFHELVSKTREWVLHRYGVVCPTPEDRWEAV